MQPLPDESAGSYIFRIARSERQSVPEFCEANFELAKPAIPHWRKLENPASEHGEFASDILSYQSPFAFRDADLDPGAGVELEEVSFDTVAEDHTALGHLRFEDQWGVSTDVTKDHIG